MPQKRCVPNVKTIRCVLYMYSFKSLSIYRFWCGNFVQMFREKGSQQIDCSESHNDDKEGKLHKLTQKQQLYKIKIKSNC